MKNIYVLTLAVFLFQISVNAQQKYSSSNKKAVKFYEEALQVFNSMDYAKAVELMNKAIKADEDFIEASLVLAEIYIEKGDRINAIESYKKAISINPDFFPGMYFSLAQLEMLESEFGQAKIHLNKYLTYKNIKPVSISQAKIKLKSCEFAIEAIQHPVPFKPVNLGENINSDFDEYWPSLTADEQTLIITRLIPKSNADFITNNVSNGRKQGEIDLEGIPNMNNFQEDFFISKKENEIWGTAINAGKPLNTAGNEGAQTILVDGKQMYFTACNRPDGKGRCDIYVSKSEDGKWNEPTNIGKPVNTAYWEAQPSISSDGKTLYFVSNRNGGIGQKDIWMSTLRSDGVWMNPVNLGDKVNSAGQEQSPFIHPDNKTLYFASDGKIGMGGFDLFKVTRNDDGTWNEPENLGYPINTVHNEIGLIVNAKGDRAYYSSDRIAGNGRDIFEFELYKEARPQPVSYLKGVVFNADNKENLNAHFELIDLDTKKIFVDAESDPITGEFLICIPTNKDYALNVSKKGFLFYSDNFSLKGIFEISAPYLKDIALQPIKPGEKIILRNIFYETGSYKLEEKSVTELTKLVDFLTLNPTLKIEISGHTDNVGTEDYNNNLSENRAKSVFEYLLSKQINKERLSYKGYGEKMPISSNETEEGKANNRRTEILILK